MEFWLFCRTEFSEFRSEPFRGRENNLEFCSVEQKLKQIFFHSEPFRGREKQLGDPFPGTKIDETLEMPLRTIPWKKKQLRKDDY